MSKPTDSIWKRINVSWAFVTNLCGSVPSDPNVVQKWIDARKPAAKPPQGKSIEEIQEEVVATLAEPEAEFSRLVFQRMQACAACEWRRSGRTSRTAPRS